MEMKESLLGKSLEELQQITSELSMAKFRAAQMADWIYKKRVTTIDEMTNLSQKDRENLSARYEIGRNDPMKFQESKDGTKKYLYRSRDQRYIEAVYIPDRDRATLCISSQIGCKMGCTFCMTGRQGFQGQLSSAEILNQIFSLPEVDSLTNIVYMGMGEPLDNLEPVMASLDVMTSPWGLAWSPKRITLSTIGLISSMKHFLDHSSVHLAVSMHSPFHEERKELMPIQTAQPIGEVIKTLRKYDFSGQRRISFEYIMFQGVNDSMAHAREIVKLVSGLRCRFNLIRFHAIPDSPLKGCSEDQMVKFRDYLNKKGITCTIRASRGQDILAACGMLSTKELQK